MSMSGLEIDVRPREHTVEIFLSGEIDLATTPALRECLQHVDVACRTVVLDLSGVSFMDSSGIAELIRARHQFDPELRDLWVRNPEPNVQRVLEMTGVADLCLAPAAAPEEPLRPGESAGGLPLGGRG